MENTEDQLRKSSPVAEIDDGGQVYPPDIDINGNWNLGITLRDHFAGLAMQGLLADNAGVEDQEIFMSDFLATPGLAYKMADAMIKQSKLKP